MSMPQQVKDTLGKGIIPGEQPLSQSESFAEAKRQVHGELLQEVMPFVLAAVGQGEAGGEMEKSRRLAMTYAFWALLSCLVTGTLLGLAGHDTLAAMAFAPPVMGALKVFSGLMHGKNG